MKFSLCPNCSSCPEIDVREDGVLIGEEDNLVRLKKEEWNVLKGLIKEGKV